jgi:hypothetical protein
MGRWAAVLAGVLGVTVSSPAWAGGGAATDAYDGIRRDRWLDVHGLLDVYVQHDFDAPASHEVQLRAFDGRSDTPALNLARVTVAHAPDRFGFRLDVGVGDLPNAYLTYDPEAVDHPDVARALSYVEQGFVTAVVPVGRGLAVDVGKFGTPVGLEDNETISNWSYSRSLLFLLAEPSYHTGLRATYELTDSLAVSAFWLDGWDANVLDGNGMRSFAGAVSWHAADGLDVVADYMAGLERAATHLDDPTLTFRHELDAYAMYALRSWLSFAVTGDYGRDARDGGAEWWGVGGSMRGRILPWLAATVRGESFRDVDGFMTGTRQRIAEGTATLEASTRLGPVRTVGRLEYRRDRSDQPVFQAAGARMLTHQDTLTLGVMLAF